jgi:hypothetical protein
MLLAMSESEPPKLDYASPRLPQKWVTVKTYMNSLEAELAATLLRREGILCQVYGETANATLGIYGPGIAKIEVQVLEEEEESSRRMLDEIEEKRRERMDSTLRCPKCSGRAVPRTPTARKWMWGLVIVCAAVLVFSKNGYFCIGVSVALAMALFVPLMPRWQCRECHHDWRAPEPPEWDEESNA